jgi:outer membrane protein TolC
MDNPEEKIMSVPCRFLLGLSLFVLLALPVAAEDAVDLPSPLTLETAKRIACQDNPSIAASQARIEAALAAIRESAAAYYPTVSVSASAVHYRDLPTGTGTERVESYALNGTVSYLVFDGFARKFRVLAAEAGAEASREAEREARRLLLRAVSAAYYDCLLGREAMLVAQRDAEFNRELSEETQKRFQAGAAARSDVLNFEIRTTAAESQQVQSAYEYQIARIVLARLMGLPRETAPESLNPASLPEVQGELRLPALDAELDYALLHRPDYRQIEERIDQLKATQSAVRGSYLPTIGVQGGYGWSRDENPRFNASRDTTAYVGAELTWDLYTGGSTQAQVARYQAEILAAKYEQALSRQAIMAELRQLVEAAQVAKTQVELQTRIEAMTEEARKLVRNEYLAGRASLTRLNEAQTDLVRAAGNLASARILYWKIIEEIAAASAKNLVEQP